MTAFRLNLGDRLLGERPGRDIHLVPDFSATENLLNPQNCCIEDNRIAFLLCKPYRIMKGSSDRSSRYPRL